MSLSSMAKHKMNSIIHMGTHSHWQTSRWETSTAVKVKLPVKSYSNSISFVFFVMLARLEA